MTKNRKIIISSLVAIFLISFLFNITTIGAASSLFNQASSGLKNATDAAYGDEVGNSVKQTTFTAGLIKIINNLLAFVGVLFLLLLIYAGYLWMTARGKEEQIEKAKKITREVVIGLIIIILAKIITELVLTYLSSAIGTSNEI